MRERRRGGGEYDYASGGAGAGGGSGAAPQHPQQPQQPQSAGAAAQGVADDSLMYDPVARRMRSEIDGVMQKLLTTDSTLGGGSSRSAAATL